MLNNEVIKARAKEKKVFLWEVAERIGLSEFTFSRKLRRPLADEDYKEVIRQIDVIAAEKQKSGSHKEVTGDD